MWDWPFRYVVVADFEFDFGGHATPEEAGRSGERPRPSYMVAKELRSGQEWRLRRGDFRPRPPFPIGPDTLFVAYYASAELGCFRALGWPMPCNILDLYVEFRNLTNGLTTPAGSGLLGALTYFGLDTIGTQEKAERRASILSGGPWTEAEDLENLEYCAFDTNALACLAPAMASRIDLPRALLRGRYMAAAAAVEWNGTPIDTSMLALFREQWHAIQDELIRSIDANYNVFDGRSFRTDRWLNFLSRHNIPWPIEEDGRPALDSDTFREMAKAYPVVAPIHELRHALSQLRLEELAVGRDGRNRTLLSAFRSSTGRNQPSNSRYIFGPSVWLRGLIKPPPGYGLAYVDWVAQEFGISARLSNDPAKLAAYESGDVYLAFGKQIDALPADATKDSHEAERQLFKACILGIQYGMEEQSLAARIRQPRIFARNLLRAYRELYWISEAWSDAAVDQAMLYGSLHTTFGWRVHVDGRANPRSLRNFPMQANGAEMLRLACIFATEAGIEVCATVHDAVLICAPLDRLEADTAEMRKAMAKASSLVLDGFELRTDVKYVRYPDRFMDRRGVVMWDRVVELVSRRQGIARAAVG